MNALRNLGVVTATALALGACATASKIGSINPFHGKPHRATTASRGVRIPVIAQNEQLKVADALNAEGHAPKRATAWSAMSVRSVLATAEQMGETK